MGMLYLFDIVHEHSWEEISPRFEELYPGLNEKGRSIFKHFYGLLLKTEPIIPYDGMFINISLFEDGAYSVVGVREGTHYALSFVPRANWIGMDVRISKKLEMTEIDILCHCLYEMTYHGYPEREKSV